MLRSILIGLVAGQRAMTPLALVAGAARRGTLPGDAPALLRHPAVAAGAVALAAAEMAGDKMASAPDRTVLPGLAARTLTSAFAGAALAPKDQRRTAAALAVAAALASSYAGLALRKRAMRRYGQTATGFVEDAALVGSGLAIVGVR
jgi:uncharacterized membrane protein